MRRSKWMLILALLMMFSVFTTGCGQKDAADIVGDLEDTLDSIGSYKALGTMKIQTGENPQNYAVEVWYKEPHYYRIALNNESSNVTQIVLKNDDGVFVLDPSLNKSFRFKSDWPESSGQIYLFQSLAKSIIDDGERTFAEEEENYMFHVDANYQNQNLSQQKIWLDKDLHPVRVAVFDTNETQIVEMVFETFDFDVEFDEDAFDMQRNLQGWNMDTMPTIGEAISSKSFGVIEPSYIPEGTQKHSPKIVNREDGRVVVIKYTGDYNFSLSESRPTATMASAPDAAQTDIVDLGFGVGIITEMVNTRSLTWTYDGVEFQLSGDLPRQEMVAVAKSVLGQPGK